MMTDADGEKGFQVSKKRLFWNPREALSFGRQNNGLERFCRCRRGHTFSAHSRITHKTSEKDRFQEGHPCLRQEDPSLLIHDLPPFCFLISANDPIPKSPASVN